MILRLPRVMELTGLGRTSIWMAVQAGTFPQPIKLGERAVGYDEDEVKEWIEARKAARTERQAA